MTGTGYASTGGNQSNASNHTTFESDNDHNFDV